MISLLQGCFVVADFVAEPCCVTVFDVLTILDTRAFCGRHELAQIHWAWPLPRPHPAASRSEAGGERLVAGWWWRTGLGMNQPATKVEGEGEGERQAGGRAARRRERRDTARESGGGELS